MLCGGIDLLGLTILSLFFLSLQVHANHVTASQSNNAKGMPGKVAVWMQREADETKLVNEVRHHTASLTTYELHHHLGERLATSADYIVVLTHEASEKSLLSDSALIQALRAENTHLPLLLSNVYRKTESEVDAPITAALSDSLPSLAAPKVVTISELQQVLQQQSHDGVTVFKLSISDEDLKHEKFGNLLMKQYDAKILFIAYDEPQSNAIATKLPRSQYHRILKSSEDSRSVDTTDPTSIYYKPEGAEYAIYYADTYLYLTPDMFTGIVTALFMIITVLLGLSCMGNIQGMSSFYDKCPPIGKEA